MPGLLEEYFNKKRERGELFPAHPASDPENVANAIQELDGKIEQLRLAISTVASHARKETEYVFLAACLAAAAAVFAILLALNR